MVDTVKKRAREAFGTCAIGRSRDKSSGTLAIPTRAREWFSSWLVGLS